MQWLNTALVATITSTGVLFLLFVLVRLQYRKTFLGYWASAWGAYGMALACILARMEWGPHWALWGGQYTSALVSGWFILVGMANFCQRDVGAWWHTSTGLLILWVWAALATGGSFSSYLIPVFVFTGAIQMRAGFLLLNTPLGGKIRLLAGVSLIIWGLHRADYPLLREVTWFAPWGFMLAAVLSFVVSLSLLLLLVDFLLKELKETHGRLDVIMEVAPVGLGLAKDRIIKWNNPCLERLLGRGPGELLGQPTALIYRDQAEYRRVGREFYSKIQHAGTVEMEVTLKHKDGSPILCKMLGRALTLGQEEQGIIVAMMDMSQQKRTQEGLRRLAAGVAHNFNNALMAITSNAQAAQAMLKGDPPNLAALESALDNVVKGALGGKDVAGRLAASVASRPPDSGCWELVDLAEVVDNSLSLAATSYPLVISGRVALENHLPKGLVVRGVPGELVEVVLNLVDNAVESMPEGGRLVVSGEAEDGVARVVFADQGRGMDAATIENAFEPFFTTKGSRGQGLGLNSSQGLIESHGGRICLDSWPGKGTTVSIHLPLYSSGEAPQATRRQAGEAARIMLVEDEFLSAIWLKNLLEGHGYSVEQAGNLAEAREMLSHGETDLVISDYSLPDGTIADLISAGGLMSVVGGVPLIVATGWSERDMAGQFNNSLPNCQNILYKPLQEEILLERVESILKTNSQI